MRFTSSLLLLAGAVAAFSSASAVTPCPATGDRSSPAYASPSPLVADENVLMYVGAYTRIEAWVNGTAKGINTFSLNTRTGALTHLSETDVGINPTFIRGTSLKNKSKNNSKPKKQYLYVVNEVDSQSVERPGTTTGYVVALEVTGKGQFKVLNRVETRGNGPLHVSMSPNEDFVAASMYLGSGVIMYPVNKTDGSLEAASDSHFYSGGSKVNAAQETAHLHSMTWVPGTQLVFAADLGNDQIVQYKLNTANKKLDNTTLPIIKRPPGSGPRHMAIHPSGKIAYVVDELSNTIGVFPLNADKSLPHLAIQNIATLPTSFNGTSTTADIHVSADGKFVYSSNRGHNSIAIFKVTSQATGELATVGHESTRGEFPRSFLLFKDLLVVANQNSGNLEVFRVKSDGTLTHTGQSAKSNSAVSVFIPEQ